MRSSAPEGQHAPRAKQAPPSGSSGATAGPTGVQPTSPHSNSISSRPQTAISHKTASPLALSQRSSGVANPSSNRVSSHYRSIAGLQSQQQQRSNSKVGGSVPAPQLQQHQRSPPTTPTPSTQSTLQQPLPSGGKPLPQLQTPNKLLQSRVSQTHLNLPQSQIKPNSIGSQPRLSDSSSKQASPKLTTQQQPPTNPPNFGEYDDQEWDVGVGHLIIDLDADIAQADRGRMSGALPSTMVSSHQGTPGSAVSEDKHSLKMKIKRTKPPTKTSEAKHEIVKPDVVQIASPGITIAGTNGNTPNNLTQHNGTNIKIENNGTPRTPVTPRTVFKKEKRRLDVNGSPSSPPPPSCTSQRIVAHPTLTSSGGSSTLASYSTPPQTTTSHYVSAAPSTTSSNTVTSTSTVVTPLLTHSTASSHPVNILGHQLPQVQVKTEPRTQGSVPVVSNTGVPKTVGMQPQHCPSVQQQTAAQTGQQSMQVNIDRLSPNKRQKLNEDECAKKDACVGTSVGTITEPDCLGPCEPGSSVTLEGIVWHETEGGVLVVNVTWRGKTYVGTLLDCTKHDWAPPRYCDSPTSDLESRTPKGRAKRGRTAASSSNATTTTHTPAPELSVTETRSGKLRNATIKGRRGGGTPTFNPPPSPVKSEVGGTKRKGREAESSQQPDPKNFKKARSSSRGTPTNGCSSPSLEQQLGTPQPTPNCNSEHSNPPSSPQLIECPEPNCNKKYKHINGLKYHQSHAHTNSLLSNEDEASTAEKSENSEVEDTRHPSPTPVASTPVDASSQDLIKPAVLRPTVPSLPPQSVKGEVGLPISSLQVLGTNTQLPVTPQQVYVYPKSAGNASPQNPSATVPSLTSSNKVLVGNESSLPNQLTGATQNFEVNNVSQTFEVNTISQQQAVEEQLAVSQSQSINKHNQTNASSKSSHIIQSPMQGFQPQPVPVHLSQSTISSQIHAQSLPLTQSQTVQSNNTNSIQSPQTHLTHQLNLPSQIVSPQSNQPVQALQNITTSTPILTTQTHPTIQVNAGGPPSHLNSSTNPNSLLPSSQPNVQSLAHISSQPYFSPQNHSFSAYSPQILESCPPSLASQHSSPQNSRMDVLGGLMPVNASISRGATESTSPIQNMASVIPMNVSSIPQGTPLSSLPGSSPMLVKEKTVDGDKLAGKSKELVNGLSPKKEEEISREDARSPAYSDISDANDSTSVIDGEIDSKDFKDEKKSELPLGANSHYAYNLYFGAYGQPHHPYMMPSLQPPPGLPMKPGDMKDLKEKLEKDKKEGATHLPGGNDYLKFPPQYMYSYSHIYPPGYPDPYMREPMYKELIDKAKFEQKESQLSEEIDKGPTDLSRSNIDKISHNHRELQTSVNSPKEFLDSRGHSTPEKRPIDPVHAYRYINSYDNRVEKSNEPKISINTNKSVTPIPLSSPRLGSTPPINNKDDKNEKRNEAKSEGVKPTMETTGPPPPPTSSAYYPPFPPYSHVAFDPYRPSLVPGLPAGFPQSYLHGPHSQNLGLRYPMGIPNGPEDLSRSGSGGPVLSPSGLYAGSHKIAELQERAQKLQSGQPVSSASSGLTRGNSPLTMYSKELHCNNMVQLPPHSMSPISSQSSTSFTSSIASQHGSMMASNMGHPGDRKTPPVGARMTHPLPESYSYPHLSAQFPPHFAVLGVTQPSMPTVGGPGLPPSGLGGAVHPPK